VKDQQSLLASIFRWWNCCWRSFMSTI